MNNLKKIILIVASIIIILLAISALQDRANRTNKGAISGRVTTVQDEPVADAAVIITGDSPSHKDISALTNEQGEYRFDDLLSGDYTIMVKAENYVSQIQHAHVEAGHITGLDFSLTILMSNTIY